MNNWNSMDPLMGRSGFYSPQPIWKVNFRLVIPWSLIDVPTRYACTKNQNVVFLRYHNISTEKIE